jgi:cytochrome P450
LLLSNSNQPKLTAQDTIRMHMRRIALIGTMRNVCDITHLLPKPKDKTGFTARGIAMLERRMQMGKTREDVFTHLLGEDSESGVKFTLPQLAANARLMIIAGSDTTSSVLINIFRELALNPTMQQKLYEEVLTAAKELGTFDCHNTAKGMPFLQAVVDEACRLYNPVASGGQSQTGPDGATIAGRFIPPNTAVRVFHLALMTDDRHFPDGGKFWPERWTEHRKEGVKDIRAFVPFS